MRRQAGSGGRRFVARSRVELSGLGLLLTLLWGCQRPSGSPSAADTANKSATPASAPHGASAGTLAAVGPAAAPALQPDRPRPNPTDPASSPRPQAALWPTATDPPLKAAPGYVGSEVCASCHPAKHSAWQSDWHARALAPVQLATDGRAAAVRGRFDEAHFVSASSEAWMHRDPSGYFMTTRDETGTLRDVPVSFVIGGKRMQDSIAILPDGRWQVLPVYYHVTSGAWVDYNERKQGQVSAQHPFFWTRFRRNANHECLDCHTTGLNVSFDRQSQHFRTGFADAGVGCESCHGPGAAHAESKSPADIVSPGKLHRSRGGKAQAFAICAQCHGPRQPVFPILDAEHHFRPGDDYGELYLPLVLTNGKARSGEFFADGRPSSSSFEVQALLQSRCYQRGGATCLDCHTAPHATHGEDELPPGTHAADAGCLRCHRKLATAPARARHSQHKSAIAQSCVSCHMPKVVSGVLDAFADHSIDVPVPQNEARHAVPSACRRCHGQETPNQLADSLARLWPGAARRQARRLRLADAIDEKTAPGSEAALRAVLADRTEAPSLRAACAQLFAQRFPKSAFDVLLPLLSDPSSLVRTRALEGLGGLHDRRAGDHIAPLLQDRSRMVRLEAALALAMASDPRAEAPLRKMARDPIERGLLMPHYVLGLLAMRQGDPSAAATRLEQAVDRVPYYTDALLALAEIYARTGRPALARQRLQELLSFEPQHPVARDALRRIPPTP